MRSGSLTRPRPLVAFDCGSQSTSSVSTSAAAMDEARLIAVVVLPTPPFWLATAMTRPIWFSEESERRLQNRPNRCAFAMTDFSATSWSTHSASCKTSYSCLRRDLPQKCSTWEHPPSPGGLVWNVPRGTLLEFSLGRGASKPGAMFHVEHYPGWDPPVEASI